MSISEDYERLRKKLGNKKYKALDRYIQEFGKSEEWHQGIIDIRPIEDIKEWEKKYFELHQKCKPIFIEDVVLNQEEWKKFEKWYHEQTKEEKQNKKDRNKERSR